MQIMRRRKFTTQKEIRGKEKNNNMLHNKRQKDTCNDQNKSSFKESEYNGEMSRIENTSGSSDLRINKSTSTIPEDAIMQNILNEENWSNNKGAIESNRGKIRHESNNSEQLKEKPVIHKIKIRNSKHKTFSFRNNSKHIKPIGSNTDKVREEIIDSLHDDKVHKIVKEQVPRTSYKTMCRICHGGNSISEFGQLVSACSCKGTIGRVHVVCLETWLTESGKSKCELCSRNYSIRRVHKYGVLRALVIWLLSQNSKQLIFDVLGTILMMPIAVLAAWLSGTTLLNLMAQDDGMAAWPLVSSFMLSCTTLVCYYCWIVSAATRHAIGWWIWYQSQYEVKLLHFNLQDDDGNFLE